MAKAEVSTTIDRPVADVFAVLTDVEKNASWSSAAISGRKTSPGPVGLGTTAREISKFLGRRIEVDSEIVEFQPDRTFSYVTSSGPFPFRGSFTVEPTDGGTRVTARFEAQPTGLFKIGDGLFGILARRQFEGDLATLKRLMEAGELAMNDLPRTRT